jgi:KamA family protein
MKYQVYARHNFKKIPAYERISEEQVHSINVVSEVLPFKTNNYVVNELIDWDNYQDDPMFVLNFPQKEMLHPKHYHALSSMIQEGAGKTDLARFVHDVRYSMNPHPAGQLEHNVPTFRGTRLPGIQHKYRETMLFFPTQGQTCHAYCTFCFRWPQFTGMNELKFAMKQTNLMIGYLKENPSITDILFTGGDPMVMRSNVFGRYIEALLNANLPHLKTIRIGTKSLSFWPYRFLTDPDANEMLDIFRRVNDHGVHVALMAHFNHHRELETDAVQEAASKIRETGTQIRTQSPVLKHINDDPEVWAKMWQSQVDLGMVPYYMFIARDTGAQSYFGVTLDRAQQTFNKAYRQVSGISRTVRGPSMSAGPGKIRVVGTAELKGEKVFVLEFLQGRNPEWVGVPFFAKYNPDALWINDLTPAFGETEFFYQREYDKLKKVDTLPGPSIKTESKQSA